MNEIWIPTGNINNYPKTIIAVSSFGRIKCKDGSIRYSKYGDKVTIKGKQFRIYRFLADNFLIKTDEDIRLNRNQVDHITHNPSANINNINNLRWCTQKENMGFDEARVNNRKGQLGSKHEPRSEFGKKFFEHYKLHYSDNVDLYTKEKGHFYKHKKCSWE